MNKLAQLLTAITALKKEAARRDPYYIPREGYLPREVRDMDPFIPEGTDLTIYQWDTFSERKQAEQYWAMVFKAKQAKPIFYSHFGALPNRKLYMQKLIEQSRRDMKSKLDYKREQQEAKNALAPKVGDILYRSWGYDQTNVDFYQVTKVLPKAVEIREVSSKVVRDEGSAVYVVAVPNSFSGPPVRKVPQPSGTGGAYSVKVTSYSRASLWDGKPKYETGSGWGH